MSINIHNVGFTIDSKLSEFISEKLGKLNKFYNKITDANVYLKLENSGQVKDKVAEVTLAVPGKVLVSKKDEKTFEASIDACAQSLERQLKKYKEKKRAV